MAQHRILQVNELLKREVGQIFLREVDFPEGVLVTVTRVEAFPNLQGAKVYISVTPDGKAKEVLRVLGRNIYEIQQMLNKNLRMRPVPRIQWVLETAVAQAQRIEMLLDQIQKEG